MTEYLTKATGPAKPPRLAALPIVRAALIEDIGPGDITSETTVPVDAIADGWLLAKADGVACGLWVVELVFSEVDARIAVDSLVPEAMPVRRGERLGHVRGPARSVLAGERVALNFLQRMSGIATMASAAARAVAGTGTVILDTRKTTPGLRLFEKYAVRAGGAANHRFGLFDMVLIKDNHIRLAGGIRSAVAAARRGVSPMVKIEVEAATLAEVGEAIESGADVIMLDNMDLPSMARAVKLVGRRALVEASGNMKVETCAEVAKLGVDFISMGALTHSFKALDISLELELQLGSAPSGTDA
jgi:nicotinate-nucleotide pyrophosphorylase (carboxylating)